VATTVKPFSSLLALKEHRQEPLFDYQELLGPNFALVH